MGYQNGTPPQWLEVIVPTTPRVRKEWQRQKEKGFKSIVCNRFVDFYVDGKMMNPFRGMYIDNINIDNIAT